jgi:hypothetical protein
VKDRKKLLLEFQSLQQQYPESQAISGNLAYLEKRKEQMQSPRFQAQGWPIGSEVVEARLKGSGMHWAERYVNSMLALRNLIGSDRWKEEWPKIEARLRQQTRQRRRRLHQTRIIPPQTSPAHSTPRLEASLSKLYQNSSNNKMPPKNIRTTPGEISNTARRCINTPIPHKM